MPERITKFGQVQEHLLNHKVINTWSAIRLYKATRLSHYILLLRKQGYDIESVKMKGVDTNGNNSVWVDYRLRSLPKEGALQKVAEKKTEEKPKAEPLPPLPDKTPVKAYYRKKKNVPEENNSLTQLHLFEL